MNPFVEDLTRRYPALAACAAEVDQAAAVLIETYEKGGKVLLCGNGGSCADADHIVGELMKGFARKRPLPAPWREKLAAVGGEAGEALAQSLQMPLRALSLQGLPALSSAYANDVSPEYVYAQQAFGLADEGDVLVGISTSGNAANVCAAALAAKARGAFLLGLTGADGGRMNSLFDLIIKAPARETHLVQELHLPMYHTLCLAVEAHFFEE